MTGSGGSLLPGGIGFALRGRRGRLARALLGQLGDQGDTLEAGRVHRAHHLHDAAVGDRLVAAPIGWEALADAESAGHWTIRDADALLERPGSPELKGLAFARQKLPSI